MCSVRLYNSIPRTKRCPATQYSELFIAEVSPNEEQEFGECLRNARGTREQWELARKKYIVFARLQVFANNQFCRILAQRRDGAALSCGKMVGNFAAPSKYSAGEDAVLPPEGVVLKNIFILS